MGVDIETHRCRIGTFRHGCGTNVCTIEVLVNLTQPFKSIGSVIFIGTLLIMAGIESNPGPKEEEEVNGSQITNHPLCSPKEKTTPEDSSDVNSETACCSKMNTEPEDNSEVNTRTDGSSKGNTRPECSSEVNDDYVNSSDSLPENKMSTTDHGSTSVFQRLFLERNKDAKVQPKASMNDAVGDVDNCVVKGGRGKTWLMNFPSFLWSRIRETMVQLNDSTNETVGSGGSRVQGMCGYGNQTINEPEDSSERHARPGCSFEGHPTPKHSPEGNDRPKGSSEGNSRPKGSWHARPKGSSEGHARPKGSWHARSKDSSEGLARPKDSSEGHARPNDRSEGHARPKASSDGHARPKGSWHARPKDSSEGHARPKGNSEGNARPKGNSEGNATPKYSSEGNARPKDSSEGHARPKGNSEGNARPKGSSEGNATPKYSSERNATHKYSSEGNARPKDRSEGHARPKYSSEWNATHKYSSEGNARPKDSSEGHARPKGNSEGNATPKYSSEGNATPKYSSDGNARPKDRSEGHARPKCSSEGNARPKYSSEGNATPKYSSDGNARPKDRSEGHARPKCSSEGNATPKYSSEGNARPIDSSEGNARTKDSSEGNAIPKYSSEGNATPKYSSEVNARPEGSSEVNAKPTDSSEVYARPKDSSEGNARPKDISEGHARPKYSSEGNARPKDISEGHARPKSSKEEIARPTDSSKGYARPKDSSEGNVRPNDISEGHARPKDSSEGNARPDCSFGENTRPTGSSEANTRPECSSDVNAKPKRSSKGKATQPEGCSEVNNVSPKGSSEENTIRPESCPDVNNVRPKDRSEEKARRPETCSDVNNARPNNSSKEKTRRPKSCPDVNNARPKDSSEEKARRPKSCPDVNNARPKDSSEEKTRRPKSDSEVNNVRPKGSSEEKTRSEGSSEVNARPNSSYKEETIRPECCSEVNNARPKGSSEDITESEDSPVVNFRIADLPSKPVGPLLVNKLSDNSVMLAWQSPVNESTLTEYIIEYKQSTCTSWEKINHILPTQTWFVADGLIEGNSYYFRVKAINTEGESEPLETDKETPLGKKKVRPSAPGGPIGFSDITDTSVTITWKPNENDGYSPTREYILEAKETSKTAWSRIANVTPGKTTCRVQDLKAKQKYVFRVFAENDVGKSDDLLSEIVTLKSSFRVPAKPMGPLNVNKVTENRLSLSWHPPDSDGGSPLTLYVIEYRQATCLQWEKLGDTRPPETSFRHARITRHNDYHFRVKAVNDEGESESLETEKPTSIRNWIIDFRNLLETLKLKDKYPGKIEINEFLSVDMPSKADELSHADLPWVLLKNIILAHSDSRDKIIADVLERINNEKEQVSRTDIFKRSEKDSISPLDIFNIVVQCCNPFVKSMLYKKLYLCKLAVPFCSKYADCKDKVVSIWPLRSIVIEHNKEEYTALQMPTCTVSVVRIGRPRLSKSKLLNKLLSRNGFDTFFNRGCPDGTKERRVSQGNTEVFWLIPEANNDVVKTIFNLRGDIRTDFDADDKNLLSKLTDILCIVVELDEIIEHSDIIDSLIKLVGKTILIVNNPRQCPRQQEHVNALTNKTNTLLTFKGDTKINHLELVKQMQTFLLQYTGEISLRSLESRLSSKPYKRDDESGEDYLSTNQCSVKMLRLIEQESGNESIKMKVTPAQCKHAKDLGRLNRELYNVQLYEQNKIKVDIKTHLRNQLKNVSPVVKSVAKALNDADSKSAFDLQLFISWMSVHLDIRTRELLSPLIKQNKIEYEHLWKCKDEKNEEGIRAQIVKVKQSSDSIANNLFSVQHLFREIAMIYEACLQTKTDSKTIDLPETYVMVDICAELMVRGYPFELLNGEDNYMPYSWIEKVIQKTHIKVGKERVFAISILGLQSSGKSTLLNTMFGSQFSVSAGRCTRGVHMQLLPVRGTFDKDMPFKYVLLIDTEGLRAPELGNESFMHDNKMATFVTGLGDITLLNIMGENMSEIGEILQIMVHAFLRLKLANNKLDLKKRCVFVHHNVVDMSAPEKMHQGLQKIMDTLDNLTKEAASSEGISDIDRFNQVIDFDIKSNIWYFPNLWHGNPPFARVNEKYSDKILELRCDLMNTALSTKTKSYKSLADTVTHINDLWKGVIMENFVFSFRNSLEIKAYTWFEKRFQDILWKAESSVFHAVESDTMFSFSKCETVDKCEIIHTDVKRKMTQLISEKRAETTESVKGLFENNDFKEIISGWKTQRENRLALFWDDLSSRALSDCERLLNKRKIELKTASMCKDHEMELYDMSRVLAKKIKEKEIEEHDINSHFEKIWSKFEDDLPRQNDNKRSVSHILEDTLRGMLGDHVDLLNARMKDVKWPDCDTSIIQLKGSLEKTGIIKKDLSRVRYWIFQTNVKDKLSHIAQYVDTLFTTLDIDIENKCTSDCEIGDKHVKEFLRSIETWMNEMKDNKDKIKLTLKSTFTIKIFVYAASYAANRFTAQNEKYEKKHGVTAHLQRYKKVAKLRLDAMIKERSAEDTAAILFTSAIRDFARQTIITKMSAKVLNEIHQCIPRPKFNMMIEIVTDLAKTGKFEDWISYLRSAKNYASRWIKKKSECHLFGDKFRKYIELAQIETHELFVDVRHAIEKSLENNSKDSLIKTDRWLQLFTDSMETYPITQEVFNNVKVGFNEIKSETLKGFSRLLLDKLKKCESEVKETMGKTRADTVTWSHSNPYEESFKRLWGCTKTCPFCGETCAKDVIHDDPAHYCIQHRPLGCIGIHETCTHEIVLESCNYNIQSEFTHTCGVFGYKCNYTEKEKCSKGSHKYRDYRKFLPDWDIAPNSNMEDTSKIWLWFMSQYKENLKENYNIVVTNIPESWNEITKEEAIESYRTVLGSGQ